MRTTTTSDLLRRFTPPPGLSRSAPRDVRLTNGGRALIVLAWLLAIGAVAAGVLLQREAQRQRHAAETLEQHGVLTNAVVDRLWRKSGDGNPAFAAFHFDAGRAVIEGEARMQLEAWRELRQGSTLTVRYLPDDPHRWRLDGSRGGRLQPGVAYMVSATLATLALLPAASVRRQRRLLSEGRAAPAIVTAITKRHGSHGSTHREMTYEFPLLSGGAATGKASAPKHADVGTTLCVVYDPERPARNGPYPFSLVSTDTVRP